MDGLLPRDFHRHVLWLGDLVVAFETFNLNARYTSSYTLPRRKLAISTKEGAFKNRTNKPLRVSDRNLAKFCYEYLEPHQDPSADSGPQVPEGIRVYW